MKTLSSDNGGKDYRAALQQYLQSDASSGCLADAQELGQKALSRGMGVLQITTLHHEALASVLANCCGEERPTKVDSAGRFLASALIPYEAALRHADEADVLIRTTNDRVEQEARRIAHSLHDEAGQMLACVQMAFEDFVRGLPCGNCAMMENALLPLQQLEEQLRQIAHELRPTILDHLGLMPALQSLALGVSRRRKLKISVEGSTGGRLPEAVETALYRVVQAALNNVCRHANASRAEVEVETSGASIRCVVRDDGMGFDVARALQRGSGSGLGLIGILDRIKALGGTVRIESAAGKGTELVAVVSVSAACDTDSARRPSNCHGVVRAARSTRV